MTLTTPLSGMFCRLWTRTCYYQPSDFPYVKIAMSALRCGREFYYIQMEKYARQALAEGVKNASDLIVSTDSELYRVLVLHYNRNNQIEVC